MTTARRALALLLATSALVLAGVLTAGSAAAHPLGDFSVNRADRLVVGAQTVRLEHTEDLAEIPSVQAKPDIDRDADGILAADELAAWATARCAAVARATTMRVDDRRVALEVATAAARAASGRAGLPVLRLDCTLRTPVAEREHRVELVAAPAPGIGWREVTAVGDGTTLTASDVPADSPSRSLTAYPADALSQPLAVTRASVTSRPGGAAATTAVRGALPTPLARVGDRVTAAFESLAGKGGSGPLVAALALGGAVLLGAVHALAPGHGKTLVAAYLAAQRRDAVRSAATVALTVTATHTAAVLVLGLVVTTGALVAPERAYPVLAVVGGLLVAGIGVALVRDARRPHGHEHAHGHGHGLAHGLAHGHEHPPGSDDHHDDHHHHDPQHDPQHDHGGGVATLPRTAPARTTSVATRPSHPAPTRRRVVLLGLAGGLLPSPSALTVLLAATALGQAWFGVLLVLAFGMGMAGTLAGVGLVAAFARRRALDRLERSERAVAPLTRAIPVALGALLTAVGLWVAGSSLIGLLA